MYLWGFGLRFEDVGVLVLLQDRFFLRSCAGGMHGPEPGLFLNGGSKRSWGLHRGLDSLENAGVGCIPPTNFQILAMI